MGRKKLNRTKEELSEMNRTRRMRSYWKNKKKEQQSALRRYYAKKTISLSNDKI
jgi:ribosomal protein L37E